MRNFNLLINLVFVQGSSLASVLSVSILQTSVCPFAYADKGKRPGWQFGYSAATGKHAMALHSHCSVVSLLCNLTELSMARQTLVLSGEGPQCFNTSLSHTWLFSSKTTLHERSKQGQSGMYTQTHAIATLTHSTHDNTSIISVAHSQTQRLRQHIPLALIKGRDELDRG